MKKDSKIPSKDLKIEIIKDKHENLIERFKTNNKELKDFLIEDALNNQKMSISTTYL